MSTTMLSASSSGRRNVASTTNVAPCRRWAGPKTSPRKLCATIVWSRTVTLNIVLLFRVGQGVAERGQASARQPGHHLGQLFEARLARDQGIERTVAQQVQGY